jgi:hypothetical protein
MPGISTIGCEPPFYIAETGLHWGRFLKDRDRNRSTALITTAFELAQKYGFGEVERRAAGELA